MGMVAMLTADLQDLTIFEVRIKPHAANILEVSTDQARTGSYSFKLKGNAGSSDSAILVKAVPARADYYVRAAFFNSSLSGTLSSANWKILFGDGGVFQGYLQCDYVAGTVKAYRGTPAGTLLGTSSGISLALDTWYVLEAYYKVHDSTGEVTVKIDGVQVLNLTSVDTKATSNATTDSIQFRGDFAGSSLVYFDDILIRDDSWPGLGGLYVLTPTSDGADDAWTASAGNQYECVDEKPPNEYTDYIYTDVSVLNTKQLFGNSQLPDLVYDAISCVSVYSKAKLTNPGPGNIRPILRNGASYGNGNLSPLGVTTRWIAGFFTTNPNGGGAWDEAGVNATQFGVETI